MRPRRGLVLVCGPTGAGKSSTLAALVGEINRTQTAHVDVFPGDQQAQIRHQLSLSLHAIVTQQLVPRSDGPGRVPAVELLLATHAVRNLIRNDHLQKLYNEMVLGKRQGTVSLEESLARLVSSGVIETEEARIRTPRPQELDSLLAGP